MKFSPLDIYNKEFNKSTFGYNSTQVDEFLDEVGLAYERLLKDYSSLEEEKKRLEEKLENYESIQDKLEETLNRVQRTVEEQSARARQEADRIRRQAEKEADNILRQARNEADSIKREARQEIQGEKSKIENLREQKELFKIRFRSLLKNYMRVVDEGVEKLDQAESQMIEGVPEGVLDEEEQDRQRADFEETQQYTGEYSAEEESYAQSRYQEGEEPSFQGGNNRAEQLDFKEYDNEQKAQSHNREEREEQSSENKQQEKAKEKGEDEKRRQEEEEQAGGQNRNPDLDDTKIKE